MLFYKFQFIVLFSINYITLETNSHFFRLSNENLLDIEKRTMYAFQTLSDISDM